MTGNLTNLVYPCTVRVATMLWHPYVTDCIEAYPDGCTEHGIDTSVVLRTIGAIGCVFKFTVFTEEEKLVQAIAANAMDTSGLTFSPETLRATTSFYSTPLQLTVPAVEDQPVFITRQPEATRVQDFFLITIVHWTVWVSLAVLMAIVQGLSYLEHRYVLSTHKHWIVEPMSVMRANWMVFVTIFLELYNSFITIALYQPPTTQNMFNNLDELLDLLEGNSQCKLVTTTTAHAWLVDIFPINDATTSLREQRLYRLGQNGYSTLIYEEKDSDKMFRDIQNETCYVGVQYATSVPMIMRKYCGLMQVRDENVKVQQYHHMYDPRTPIGQLIRIAYASGAVDDMYQETVQRYANAQEGERCVTSVTFNTVKPLTFMQLMDSFFVLGVGMGIAVCLLLVEKIIKKVHALHRGRMLQLVQGTVTVMNLSNSGGMYNGAQ